MKTSQSSDIEEIRNLYFSLIKKTLTYSIWGEDFSPVFIHKYPFLKRTLYYILIRYFKKGNVQLVRQRKYDPKIREEGRDHPTLAHTMIGLKRLDNIQSCVEDVLAKGIPGDLIETGIWRGGALIFMRALLKAHGITNRKVWGADSFKGLPISDTQKYAADAGDFHHLMPHLAVTLDQVKDNFEKFGLLDDQVCFLEGWFKDTLPNAPIESLAVMSLDGDMYESTMDALVNLYPKLSPGGYTIIDDYGYIESCRKAVHDYRSAYSIADEIQTIDWSGVYWKKGF